ncbi:MAG: hypothetical protein H7Y11_08590 [Armatimonadetes bacterium]|nr:hypothetical protein [Anaerolineae bacterium]
MATAWLGDTDLLLRTTQYDAIKNLFSNVVQLTISDKENPQASNRSIGYHFGHQKIKLIEDDGLPITPAGRTQFRLTIRVPWVEMFDASNSSTIVERFITTFSGRSEASCNPPGSLIGAPLNTLSCVPNLAFYGYEA